MNQGVLLLACAVVAALVFVPKVRTVLVVIGAALAVAVIVGQVAWVTVWPALHHLVTSGGAR